MRRKTSPLTWMLTGLLGLGGAFFGWQLFGLHVIDPPGPVSVAEAQSFARIRIPGEAKNIRIAGYRQWITGVQYVRFEGPVDVCVSEAALLVPNEPLKPIEQWLCASDTRPSRPGVLAHFNWFDLTAPGDLYRAGGGPNVPEVWINRTRGVFYYRLSD